MTKFSKQSKSKRYFLYFTLFFFSLIFFLTLPMCMSTKQKFHESKWLSDVNSADPDLLYAPNFKDGRFFNPWMQTERGGFLRFLSWKLTPGDTYTEEGKNLRPGFIPDLKRRIKELGDEDFIAWIGHSTFLIRLGGDFWITDPMFSDRALLPKRHTQPALSLQEMQQLDGKLNIIISHNHYDHFDEPSIRGLSDDARVYVPLGLKGEVEKLGKKQVFEMDWWQTIDCGKGVTLVCLPAQHWSKRLFQDANVTLWASFLLITPNSTIYFGGDSGYFIGYREFGKKYPGIDYALLPAGAYQPRWFMHYAHIDPKEVIQATMDMGAGFFIPAHWGAFQLGEEPVGFPLIDLKKAMKESDFDPSRAIIMDIGEIVNIRAHKGRP